MNTRPDQGSAYVDSWVALAGAVTGDVPLTGLSYALKDMFDVAGHTVSGGSPEWRADGRPALTNSAVVELLHQAGADLTGSTVCDEFFYSLTGANARMGTPFNPRWPGRLPGGSSSGSAAAVASGTCDFAIGSDTGGSVRVPAAFCGTYGLRTTVGAVPVAGAMAMAHSFDAVGWFAASAGVLRRVGDVLLGASPIWSAPGVVVAHDAVELVDEDVREAFDHFLGRVHGVFADIGVCSLYGGEQPSSWASCFAVIQGREVAMNYGEWIDRRKPAFGAGIRERMAAARAVTDAEYTSAQDERRRIVDGLKSRLPVGSIALMPTTPCAPPSITADETALGAFRGRAMQLTAPAAMSGRPQLAIPVATPAGPLSVSLLGWPGSDRTLLDLAVRIAPVIGR